MSLRKGLEDRDIRGLRRGGETFFAVGGTDQVTGGVGPDTISGGRDDDFLTGGAGSDLILGGGGRDNIRGGAGDDTLEGQGGFTLRATIVGEDDAASDTLNGGAGDDRIEALRNDVAIGGAGFDTLVFKERGDNFTLPVVTIDLSSAGGATLAAIGGGRRASGFERAEVEVTGVAAKSRVTGTGGDDVIAVQGSATFVNNVARLGVGVFGGAGDDRLTGSTLGSDTVKGGAGDDVIQTGLGSDTATGGGGSDIFIQNAAPTDPLGGGGTQPDRITDFDPARDLFLLALSGPSFEGPALRPRLFAAGETPVFRAGQLFYETDTGKLFFTAGPGETPIQVATFAGRPALSARNVVVDTLLSLPFFDDHWRGSSPVAAQRAGNGRADTLKGGAGKESFFGNAGADRLTGNGGDDLLVGGRGADRIDGGAGRDRIVGGDGADTLSGGDGDDLIVSGSDAETFAVPGDGEADRIEAGAGDDQVQVDGLDSALGGAGTDTLVYRYDGFAAGAASEAAIVSFAAVGAARANGIGFDGVRAGQFERVEVTLSGMKSGSSLTGGAGDDDLALDIRFDGSDPLLSSGARPGGTVRGGAGDDTLRGSGNADFLFGQAGDDLIMFGDADTVDGGTGSDLFVWGSAVQIAGPAELRRFESDDLLLVETVGASGGATGVNRQLLVVGAGATATAPGLAQFLYDTTSKVLSIDFNGSDPGRVVQIARSQVQPVETQLVIEFIVE